MNINHLAIALGWFALGAFPAIAAVGADEAAKLKTTLTPVGAERAGNKDGTIPSWEGGLTQATPGFVNGGRRPDPFAGDKPLYSITSKNMGQYTDKLTEGTRALLTRHPEFRVDVYKTQRTFAAPQFIYDRTAKNATVTKLVEGADGTVPIGYVGGYPFPVPKTGEEVMANHQMRWSGEGWVADFNIWQMTSQGKPIFKAQNDFALYFPYNSTKGPAKDDGMFILSRAATLAPAIAKGGGAVAQFNLDSDKTKIWAYLTGQRRVKMVPHACCDTPAPGTGGTINFDELSVFDGTRRQFDWKLIGKQEMFIPYNSNRALTPTKDSDLVAGKFLNPDHVRWELHRVWVVEATLKAGKRHINPRSRYYLDEDSWAAVLGDRWDAQNQLVKTNFALPIVAPDGPVMFTNVSGAYDLVTGQWFATQLMNEYKRQFELKTSFPADLFSPDALAGEGIR